MITIGDKQLQTRRPQDLDAKLLVRTGCSASEAQNWLLGNPLPSLLAAALAPWLIGDDAPDQADLGEMIAAAGPAEVAAQVATLYAAVPMAEPVSGE